MAESSQSITQGDHHLRGHRRDPHAVDVAASADHAEGNRRRRGGAAEAGAAIVHLHARDPVDGRPTQDPKYFREFAPEIKRRSDVVINFTTGGAPTMPVEERLQPALQLKPEVASLNMGSMNFGLYPMLERFKDFKFDWERPYLEGSFDRVFKNTFQGYRTHPDVVRGQRARASRSSATTSATCTPRSTSPIAAPSRRRSSSRACSGSWAASARIRTMSRT